MGRKEKAEGEKKERLVLYVLPAYFPIIKQVVKNLEESGAIDYIKESPAKDTERPQTQVVIEKTDETPIKKTSFGIDANDWIAKNADKVVNVEEKESAQKDYTAWQSDSLMQDIYNSCLWDAGSENQCYPDGVEEYQRKYKDLWGKLNEAKRNNKTQRCNEIMTEMMERIYNE